MRMLDEIRARCACRGAIRSPEVAKQRAATRSQEAARDEIYAVARAHKAEKLWVFGSCARKEETPESDVDFLVEFGEGIGLFELFDFEQELADRVGRKVDLVNSTALERSPCFAYNVRKDMLPL